MITYSNKYRSTQAEIMDDFDLQGSEMKSLLSDLKRVNKLLGGNKVTFEGLDAILKEWPKDKPITLLDVGCGDGELLRASGKHLTKQGYEAKLIGVDGNSHILDEARNRSEGKKNIEFKTMDVFSESSSWPEFDIALCTLFLHHFPNSEIVKLLNKLTERATLGLVVNDLHRSKSAFELFKLFGAVFLKTKTAKHDGLVSVARGFKKEELQEMAKSIKGSHCIKWHWAFRYKWVISNKNRVPASINN